MTMKQFFKNKAVAILAGFAAVVMIGTVAHAALAPVNDRGIIFSASASVSGSSVTISVSNGTLSMNGLTDPQCFEKTPGQPPPFPTHNGWYSPIATQTSPANTAQITSGTLSGQTIPLTVTAGNEGSNCWDDIGSAATFSGSRTFTNVAAGNHTVNVRVTDNEGEVNNRSVSFTVAASAVPTCSPSQPAVYQNESVTFTGANGSGYTWQFTGGTGTASNPSGSGNTYATSFSNTGTKTVTVTSGGQSGTCTVNVQAQPTVSCSPGTQNATVGQPVTLTAAGGISGNYTWATAGSSSATPSGSNNSSLSVVYGTIGTKNITVTRNGVISSACTVSVQPEGLPPTLSLSASPNPVPLNTAPVLTWTVQGADTCSEDHWYWTGTQSAVDGTHTSASGSIAPHTTPGQTKNYTLTCSNTFGDVTKTVAVGTDAATPPFGVTLSASPTSGVSPLSTTLTWTTSGNPTNCSASATPANASWTGSKNVAGGTQTISGLTQSTTFDITCSKSGVSPVTASASVVVYAGGPQPSVVLLANPTTVVSGGSTVLTWGAQNVASCQASATPANAQWTGPKALVGPQTITNLTQNTTFRIDCPTGTGTVVSANRTVTVTAPTTGTIVVNSNVPTTWTISGAGGPYTTIGNQTSVQYNNVPTGSYTIAPVTPTGYVFDSSQSSVLSQVVTAGNTTTFTLNYDPEPVGASVNIDADPSSVVSGGSSFLEWSSSGIVPGTCVASGDWGGSQADSGSKYSTGALTSNSTYTITCEIPAADFGGKNGSVQDSVTVTVTPITPPGDDDDGDPQCSDEIDNDGNGLTDWPAEDGIGCDDAEDNYENSDEPGDDDDDPIGACNDGFDNDGDGFADYPEDPGCSSPTDTTEQGSPDIREI